MRFNHAENFLSASLPGAFFSSLSRAARDGEGGKGCLLYTSDAADDHH